MSATQQPAQCGSSRHVPDLLPLSPSRPRGRNQHAMPGAIRRIRQACTRCRHRKTKCSGEHPKCANCSRVGRECHYEPYSSITNSKTVHSSNTTEDNKIMAGNDSGDVPSQIAANDLMRRIKQIESQLARLNERGVTEPRRSSSYKQQSPSNHFSISSANNSPSSQPTPGRPEAAERQASISTASSSKTSSQLEACGPGSFTTLPPPSVIQSLVDTYFLHVHGQPYSYFHETSFRDRFENDALPRCLVLSILASAVRFSDDQYFKGVVQQATEGYAREAWLSVLNDHMTAENSPNLHVAQTSNILAVIDFTSGRTSSGWLKIGLAVRIAQDLQLMREPDSWTTTVEKEEARRTFWSIYLLDRLISCGKGRPPAILDDDCSVQLPGGDGNFEAFEPRPTETLHQILDWNANPEIQAGNFGLSIVAASILGQCNRYLFHQREGGDQIPPWDPRSEYASLESSLLLADRILATGTSGVSDIVRRYQKPDGSLLQHEISYIISARVVFHLAHCLLNHPFLIRLRLRGIKYEAPPNFISQMRQKGAEHAQKLAAFLDGATAAGCHVAASFYAYAACVAGSILSLMKDNSLQDEVYAKTQPHESFEQVMEILERMGSMWDTALKMHLQLTLFDASRHALSAITNFDAESEIDTRHEDLMWLLVDYNAMSASSSLQTAFGAHFTEEVYDPSSMMDFELDFHADNDFPSEIIDGQVYPLSVFDVGGSYVF